MNLSANDSHVSSPPDRAVRMLLTGAGAILLVAAVAYNELFLGALFPDLANDPGAVRGVRLVELYLALSGVALIVSAWLVGRVNVLRRLARRPWVTNLVLVVMVIGVPLWIAFLGGVVAIGLGALVLNSSAARWIGLAVERRREGDVYERGLRFTGTWGFNTSIRCHAIASPSRSSSVAR